MQMQPAIFGCHLCQVVYLQIGIRINRQVWRTKPYNN
jgi:hypothetical protein